VYPNDISDESISRPTTFILQQQAKERKDTSYYVLAGSA
jgi:hypothetical protein